MRGPSSVIAPSPGAPLGSRRLGTTQRLARSGRIFSLWSPGPLGRDREPKGRGRVRGAANLTRQANAGHSGGVPGWRGRTSQRTFTSLWEKFTSVHREKAGRLGTARFIGAFPMFNRPSALPLREHSEHRSARVIALLVKAPAMSRDVCPEGCSRQTFRRP
jgi:hypothetical protein